MPLPHYPARPKRIVDEGPQPEAIYLNVDGQPVVTLIGPRATTSLHALLDLRDSIEEAIDLFKMAEREREKEARS